MSPTATEKAAASAPSILEEAPPQNELMNTARVASEILVPGASQLIAGNVASGVGHFLANGVALAVLAPAMPVLAALAVIGIRANSYSMSTRGAALWKR
jgi:hypothetical protein